MHQPELLIAKLVLAQLAGIESWRRASSPPPDAACTCGTAKEMRLDAQRRQAARQRQQEAMQARAAMHLAGVPAARMAQGKLRAIVVYPHDYQRHSLVRAFESCGRCAVIAEAADGAAGVGLAVIEQPDLVFLGQQMTYMTGFEAVPEIRRHAPRTTVAMQVAGSEYVDVALAAGAHAAFTTGTPLTRLVADVVGLATSAASTATAPATASASASR